MDSINIVMDVACLIIYSLAMWKSEDKMGWVCASLMALSCLLKDAAHL